MFDLNSFGTKLHRLRIQLEYSYEDISISTGLQTGRLQTLEEGKTEPTGDEILILADFYMQDYKYFISNEQHSASENTEVLFRKFGTEFTKHDRRSIQEFLYLCECEQDIWNILEIPHKTFVPEKLRNKYRDQGEHAGKSLRNILGYGDNHIITNIYSEFRKIGIHIFRRKLDNSDISGLFIKHPTAGNCVLVNYNEDLYRQNFTVAHEVGHALFDTNDAFNISFNGDERDDRETRANYFAASFLMPAQSLQKQRDWNYNNLLVISEQLRVNPIALLIRLKSLNIITQYQVNDLKRTKIPQYNKSDPELEGLTEKQRMNKIEILKMGLSTSYVRNCHDAYMEKKISRARLAEMLLTNELRLIEILGLFNLKLVHEY